MRYRRTDNQTPRQAALLTFIFGDTAVEWFLQERKNMNQNSAVEIMKLFSSIKFTKECLFLSQRHKKTSIRFIIILMSFNYYLLFF